MTATMTPMTAPHAPPIVARRRGRLVGRSVPALVVVLLASIAWAQVFSSERYYQQCLGFEAGGDLTTARQSCLSALEVDGDRTDVQLALGRIEFALGELGSAESRLMRLRSQLEGAEVDVLLAEILVAGDRADEARSFVSSARSKLQQRPDLRLAARLAFLEGRIAEEDGEMNAALAGYQRAIDANGIELAYRLADANLRWRTGDLDGAARQLRDYEIVTGDVRSPEVKSLLGRIAWAQGRADDAVGHIETALALRDLRDSSGQAADLQVLSILYYGQGDLQRGGLALREATLRGNLLTAFGGNTVLWLLALFVLLALHLIGESRRNDEVTPQAEGPKRWTVGAAYGVFFAAALMGLASAVIYGVVVYGNLLALLTPHQQHEARAVYLIMFAVVASLLAWQRTRALGWNARQRLAGSADGVAAGIVVGALVYAVMLGYLIYVPRGGWAGPFFLDLAWPTPMRFAALAVVPIAEFYFRGFLRPAIEERYGAGLSVAIMALVWALALATPVAALVPIGLALAEIDRRRPNGLTAVVALWIAWLGLAVTVLIAPYVRGLFL
jgi:hypothetical protein